MYLLIDVGNSRIKWLMVTGAYDDFDKCHYGQLDDLKQFIETLDVSGIRVLLAAVNQTSALRVLLSSKSFKEIVIACSELSRAGVRNSYQQPKRMGVDRWLAMVAAFSDAGKAINQGVIIVDAGSALTIDVVDGKGQHLGGYIVPGLIMAQKALFANTERVIQYEEALSADASGNMLKKLGNNTLQCVEYGIANQMAALVKQVSEEYLNYEIFFTGGDGELLASILKTGKVDKNLVLKGLWQVRN